MCKYLCIFASNVCNAVHWIPTLGNKYVIICKLLTIIFLIVS
jgi:hypothetical protein